MDLSVSSSMEPTQYLNIMGLPNPWLQPLFQNLASGPEGAKDIAAVRLACKTLHDKVKDLTYTYSNMPETKLRSPDDPFWRWLAQEWEHTLGLRVSVAPYSSTSDAEQEDWSEPLRLLFTGPGLQVSVYMPGNTSWDHPFTSQWLQEHGNSIQHLDFVSSMQPPVLSLEELVQLIRPCKRLRYGGLLPNIGALTALMGLTSLYIECTSDVEAQDPWVALASLTNLKDLTISGIASGNPSQLSALSGLTQLGLAGGNGLLSSLVPFQALQELEKLLLLDHICTATSLQGLAGLSRLREVTIQCLELVSLQGLGQGVTSLEISDARNLRTLAGIGSAGSLQDFHLFSCPATSLAALASLTALRNVKLVMGNTDGAGLSSLEGLKGSSSCLQYLEVCRLLSLRGIEHLSALQELYVAECGLSSLQPLGLLTAGVKKLHVHSCRNVEEEVLELPHIQPSANVDVQYSNVKELVLAGGFKRSARRIYGPAGFIQQPLP